MPLVTYLKPETTLILEGNSREAVLREMIQAAVKIKPELESERIWRAVMHREEELNTRVGPHIALPHARLAKFGGFSLVVGLAPQGLAWGRESPSSKVRIVILLLGDEGEATEHIRILAQIAARFSSSENVFKVTNCQESDELFRQLIAIEKGEEELQEKIDVSNERMLQHAVKLATDLKAGAFVLLGRHALGRYLSGKEEVKNCPWILAAPPTPRERTMAKAPFDSVINIPSQGLSGSQRVDVVLLIGLLNDLIKPKKKIVCVYGRKSDQKLDTVQLVDLQDQFGELLMLTGKIRRSDIKPEVLYRVLQLVNQIAVEGREGHPLGTLIVLGDYEQVAHFSHQMVMNPFRGYPAIERNIVDPSLDETMKEFAQLDGAFLVRGDGEVMSAGTCIQIQNAKEAIPSGLGTRHAAGLAITTVTKALAVVLSQSTGTIRVYKSGKCILQMIPRKD